MKTFVNPDEWTHTRNVPIRKALVQLMEQETGGKFIPDTEPDLLRDLDKICYAVWLRNGGKHTPERTVQIHTTRYIHRDVPIPAGYIPGLNVDSRAKGPKKMWFRAPVLY